MALQTGNVDFVLGMAAPNQLSVNYVAKQPHLYTGVDLCLNNVIPGQVSTPYVSKQPHLYTGVDLVLSITVPAQTSVTFWPKIAREGLAVPIVPTQYWG
jgi:hypothetical protein